MRDLISRAEAIDIIRSMTISLGGKEIFHPEAKKSVLGVFDDLAAVDAEPVRHGRWILSGPDLHGNIRPKCSVCGRYRLAQWADHIKCNYCPECGANMRGDNDAAD